MAGSIKSLGGGRWRVTISAGFDAEGKRRQVVRHVRGTRRDAELAAANLLVEVGRGDHVGTAVTVDELIDAWLRVARLEVATRRDYGYARGHLGQLGAMPIWKLRAAHLDALYADLATRGLGPDRIRRVHGIVRRAFAQAVKWGWVARNPVVDATPPPPPPPRPKPPSMEHVAKLLAVADDELVVMLALEASLGARRGELCALQWHDIDLDGRSVIIRRALADGGRGVGMVVKSTKTANERTVAIDAATATVLREHRRRAAERALAVGATLAPESYVFAHDVEGRRPWRPDSTTRRFIKLRRALGVPETVKLKDLRHFVATELLAAGVDPRTVAGRLGHARTSTTLDIYAGFVPARDRDAADLLGYRLGQHRPQTG